MTGIPDNAGLRFIAFRLQRLDRHIGKLNARIGGLEASLSERFQRIEAGIARAQADTGETKAVAREVALRLSLIEKRLTAVEHA